MFNNPKDIPFAVGMVWALYYIVRIVPELPRPRWSLVVKLGLACGLALGVRVGGLLLFGYLGLLLLSFVAVARRSRRGASASLVADGFDQLLARAAAGDRSSPIR